MKKSIIFIIFLSFFMLFLISVNAAEKTNVVEKRASIVGKKVLLEDLLNTTTIGAITFMSPPDQINKSHLYLLGKIYDGIKPTIDGRDHTLAGKLIDKSIHKTHSISTDLTNRRNILVSTVTLLGKRPYRKIRAEYLDVTDIIDFLKEHKDVSITQDVECNENGCVLVKGKKKVKYNFGTPSNPKIVVVEGARLTLKGNFKGYGILILTGERKKVPFSFYDEFKKDAVTGESLYQLLLDILKKVKGVFLADLRRGLRLVMEDNAFWGGVVISDIGIDRTRYPLTKYLTIILGRQSSTSLPKEPIIKPIKPIKPLPSRPLLWNFFMEKAYAKTYRGKGKLKPIEPVKPKPILPLPEPSKKRVKICGMVLIGGKLAIVKMGSADILYSKKALDSIDNNILKELPFKWEEYKEEE